MAGLEDPQRLLARTRAVADSCALDPRADLGLGEVHFPELDVSAGEADGVLRARCEGAVGDRYGAAPRQRIWKRLDDELELVRGLGYASYFLTVADVTDLIRERGVRCAARGSGAGSLVNYLLGGDVQVGEVHLAETEVGARVEGAGLGDGAGAGEQPVRPI